MNKFTPKHQLTLEELRYRIAYDTDTGILTWRPKFSRCVKWNAKYAGKNAAHVGIKGYLFVKINGFTYSAHRLIWFYVYGKWPGVEIDHKDGNPLNNRLDNLREANGTQNQANKRGYSGRLKGAYPYNKSKKWLAAIQVNGKRITLGVYETQAEAHATYCEAARKHFGEFARFE